MRELGMKVNQFEPQPRRVSNIGMLTGKAGKPVLLFYSHLDTVPAGDLTAWKYPPFAAEIHEGKIYGRGSCDNKQGIATTLCALRAIKECGIELNGKLMIVTVADEESGGTGIRAVIESGLLEGTDYGILAHSGVFDKAFGITTGYRGHALVKITTIGKAGHAAHEEGTINAIMKMCKVAQAINHMEFTGWKPHPVVPGDIKICVTMIEGGSKDNTIPGKCSIICDCRTLPGFGADMVLENVNRVLDGLKKDDKELDVRVEIPSQQESTFIEANEPIVQAVKKVYEDFDASKPVLIRAGLASGDSNLKFCGI